MPDLGISDVFDSNSANNSNNLNSSDNNNNSNKKKKIIVIALIAVAVIAAIIITVVALASKTIDEKVSKIDSGNKIKKEELQVNELTQETQEILEKYTTIALFGLDNRSNGNFEWGNSDVIMIASINENTKEVKLVSVYRDTYLNITGGIGYRKANAAFANGGIEQAVNMLNVNLDLNIADYVIVDFNAVAAAVDILGGVEIQVTDEEAYWMKMYIDELNGVLGESANYLSGAGTYNLNGIQATAYARVRYTAGDDYKRTERQRLVIQKMVEKLLKSDITTVNNLVDEIFPKVKTSFTENEIISLVKDVFDYKLGENTGFPFEKIAKQKAGNVGDCVVPIDLADNVKRLHEFLYGTENYQVTTSVQQISDEIEYNTGVSANTN